LCVLLLRGPQTPGELRGRAERMHRFVELEDVVSTLQRLMQREPALARALPRQPGTKEIRYMHLLSGEIDGAAEAVQPSASNAGDASAGNDRLARLEEELARLREEVAELREQMAKLTGQEP
jgi:uncharacterized protein YceH (UPF0502 family)